MKYYEVFKSGMPEWLYRLSEEERLRYDFTENNGLIACTLPCPADTYKKPDYILYALITLFIAVVGLIMYRLW